ncbi:MAG TPA: 16S rRNA (cytosine(967)-C(5))-methyltransferase RsmB [Gammaproteobacteria bacterium]|nr:16S rRNA (cytosine(967)-C(5))-methyltransferase RsmB [Gammaproteobacteria bacterium]
MPRKSAALLVQRVVDQGVSLGDCLSAELDRFDDRRQRALVQELVYGTLRWFHRLDAILGRLLSRPLKRRDRDLHALLLVGLYQLLMLEMPAHAALSETVEVARQLGKNWAAGLVNAVLRNAQRRSDELLQAVNALDSARWSFPEWWIRRLQSDWPDDWQPILEAGNRRPPMVLRVNLGRIGRDDYLEQLRSAGIEASASALADSALQLRQPVAVEKLPGFAAGLVSVQDAAAQLAAPLLQVADGQRVLDACAAPGGKTGHLLEQAPGLEQLVAIDRDATRLQRVEQNLQRLGAGGRARLLAADAGDPAQWWDGRPFDRILLDAPCSASGVVRRHPDIKLLRRDADIPVLARAQLRLLDALWPLLAPGGMLLYATCSVFKQENSELLQAFLARRADVRESALPRDLGRPQAIGRQLLPGEQDTDGFFYARLQRI